LTELEIELQNKLNAYALLFGQIRAVLTAKVSEKQIIDNIKDCFREHETREKQRRLK
jgi:hypothetical protein